MDGTSDSLDLGTAVREVDTFGFMRRTESELRNFLLKQVSQIPPKYSALHVDGKRAYDLAREGIDFILPERSIEIQDLTIESYNIPNEITLSLTISSG